MRERSTLRSYLLLLLWREAGHFRRNIFKRRLSPQCLLPHTRVKAQGLAAKSQRATTHARASARLARASAAICTHMQKCARLSRVVPRGVAVQHLRHALEEDFPVGEVLVAAEHPGQVNVDTLESTWEPRQGLVLAVVAIDADA